MTKSTFFAGIIISALLGAGIGFAIGGGRDRAPAPAPAATDESSPLPESDAAAIVPASAPSEAEEDADLLARAIAAVEPVELLPGVGSIEGRVTLIDGTPLPGVRIAGTPGLRPDREEGDELETRVRRRIRDELWEEGLAARAVTDADGRYRLEDLADLEYTVTPTLEGYRFDGRTANRRAGMETDFTALPLARIEVSVVAANGREPAQAEIKVRGGNRSETKSWTPEKRILEVEAGEMQLSATVGKTGQSDSVPVIAKADGPPVPVRLEVRSRAAIRGKIIRTGEFAAMRATAYLLDVVKAPEPTVTRLIEDGKRSRSAASGEEYEFLDLDPGSYWLCAALGYETDDSPPEIRRVDVTDDLVEVDLELLPLDPSQVTIVYAFAPDGTPLRAIDLTLSYVSPRSSSSTSGEPLRLPDGGILVAGAARIARTMRDNPDGECSVEVRHALYGTERRKLASLRGERVEVHYAQPARATVQVSGYLGSEHVGRIEVKCAPEESGASQQWGRGSSSASLDANGEAAFETLSPGEYRLKLVHRVRDHHDAVVLEQVVSIAPGENRFVLELPTLHTLVVDFPGFTAKGGQASLSTLESRSEVGTTSTRSISAPIVDGIATIEGILPGRYVLRAWGEGLAQGATIVDIPATARYSYVERIANALRVNLWTDEGAYTRAGLRDGDWIVKIDDRPIEGAGELAAMWVFLREAERVKFTVERDGELLDLTVAPKELFGSNPGGSLDPVAR